MVVEAVVVHGLQWAQAGDQFKLSRNVIARIVWRWKKQKRAFERKRLAISDGEHGKQITDNFMMRLMEASESEDGITVEKYNQLKVGQTHFKGTGIYRVGDDTPPVAPAGNNTLIQNFNFLLAMTTEQQEKLLEESRNGILDLPVTGHGADRRLGAGDEADHSGPAVVVEESDKNL